ncbi:MAG: LysR family transcriptional regulator [Gammaproteobacteria bacterium]|nr:LysR family transcriptional regulator [Gammaproteobacteria bacterium]
MHLTLRQLKVFEEVARRGSYTRAADALHLSQPAVSMQIKQLESNAGLPLFEHIGKKIFLTEAGQELYSYSRQVSRSLEDVDEVFEQLKGIKKGRLNVTTVSTASYFTTRMLAEFSRRFEGVDISLDVTNRRSLLRQLENNEPDLVIMGMPKDEEESSIISQGFMENPLVMIAPVGHPLANEKNIPLQRFADESFVVREKASGTRHAIEQYFAKQDVPFKFSMELSDNETIKQAVAEGFSLAIVSLHTLELELMARRVCVLDVDGFPIIRNWYIAHLKDKRLTPVASAFKEFVLTEAKRFIRLPETGIRTRE